MESYSLSNNYNVAASNARLKMINFLTRVKQGEETYILYILRQVYLMSSFIRSSRSHFQELMGKLVKNIECSSVRNNVIQRCII